MQGVDEFYRKVLDSLSDGVYFVDRQRTITYWNAAAERIAFLGRRYLEDRFQGVDWLSRRLAQTSPAATVARQSDWLRKLR